MGYQDDVSIDENYMEDELSNHASIYFTYSKEHAEALRDRRLLERELEQLEADTLNALRAQDANAKVKITELKSLVDGDERVQKLKKKIIEQRHEVNILAGAMEAMSTKTRMLESLVKMQLAHWQSEPRIHSGRTGLDEKKVTREHLAQLKGSGGKRGGGKLRKA